MVFLINKSQENVSYIVLKENLIDFIKCNSISVRVVVKLNSLQNFTILGGYVKQL